jgi:hypothetical protein
LVGDLSPKSVLCPLIIPLHGLHGKHVSRVIKNARLLVRYVATSCRTVRRGHRSYCCVFAGTCTMSRCLATVICVTILFRDLFSIFKRLSPFRIYSAKGKIRDEEIVA